MIGVCSCSLTYDVVDGRCVNCHMMSKSGAMSLVATPRLTEAEARAIVDADGLIMAPDYVNVDSSRTWTALVAEARARLSQGGTEEAGLR